MRLSLRTRILLLVAGTVTGLSVIVLSAFTVLSGREIERAVRKDVRATGSVLSHFLRERSATLRDQSSLLARQPALRMLLLGRPEDGSAASAPEKRPDFATVTDCLREWLGQLRADAALLTDENGKTLGETDVMAGQSSERGREAGVAAAIEGETWTGIVLHREKLMLAVTVPVLEPVSKYVRGTFTAYSAINIRVAKELKEALGSEVAFVHRGRVAGASLPLPERLPTPEGSPRLLRLRGAAYFALYAPLPDTDPKAGLGFVTLHPYGAVMERYERMRTAFAMVALLALLLALGAGAGVAHGITRPLDGLVEAARAVQNGAWPEPLKARRKDEIGLLQSVFNEMTSAMRANEARLLALIDTDPLTGLDNHRRFQERLTQETARCAASGEALSMLLFDVDHFDQYNQRHGHAAGDEALQKIALLLRNCLPEVAIVARYGGEEFVALLPQQGLEQAERFGERLRALVAETWSREPEKMALSVSVGCAEFGTHTTKAAGLALAAELALSLAKQLGRNRVCRFDSVPGADEAADPYQVQRVLQDGSLATIQALAAAVDAKDPYTRGHSQRVAEYAAALGKILGLPQAEVELIYTTGTLHDVGKIGVPDAILKKPGRLDDDERAIMETHPALGELIVRKAPQLAATLPGVRHHHERWDGKGYPDGLAGEMIPLIARLLAIADTFDAMTSDRPYRKGLGWDVALEEIARGAGTQFDPALAPLFVTLMSAHLSESKAA